MFRLTLCIVAVSPLTSGPREPSFLAFLKKVNNCSFLKTVEKLRTVVTTSEKQAYSLAGMVFLTVLSQNRN